jgi:4-carboxymuconolactone decarboxylase
VKYGRLDAFRVSDLDDDQSQMLATYFAEVDEKLNISVPTGNDLVSGPLNLLLIDPKVGGGMTRLGAGLISPGKIPPRLRELVILATARELRCETEWAAHTSRGGANGLSAEEMNALLRGEVASTLSQAESVAVRVVRMLVTRHDVPDVLYDEAASELGTNLLFYVVMVSAFYTLMAFPMIAFRAPLPPGVDPVFDPDC